MPPILEVDEETWKSEIEKLVPARNVFKFAWLEDAVHPDIVNQAMDVSIKNLSLSVAGKVKVAIVVSVVPLIADPPAL